MPYDDLRKGRFSEYSRAYFMTTVLAEREKCYFNNFFCARFAAAEMRILHDSGAVNSLAWVIMCIGCSSWEKAFLCRRS